MRHAGEQGRASGVIDRVLAVCGDLGVIGLATGSARELGYFGQQADYWSQMLFVVVVTMTAFYLANLYEINPRVRIRESAWRFVLALTAAGVLLAFLGFALPSVRLGRLAFLHIMLVISFGWPLARLYWLRVPRMIFQRVFSNHTGSRACGAEHQPRDLHRVDPQVPGLGLAVVNKAVDIVIALIGLAVSLPVMLTVAVFIKLDSRGPILSRRPFVGANGRACVLYTFRSTFLDASGRPQVTRIGRHLRATHLDELPMLLNLLMSDVHFLTPWRER